MRVAIDDEGCERAQHAQPVLGSECADALDIADEIVFSSEKKRKKYVAEMHFLLLRERRVCGFLPGECWRQSVAAVERHFERRFKKIPSVPLVQQLLASSATKKKH